MASKTPLETSLFTGNDEVCVGSLVQAVITEKYPDYCVTEINTNTSAILPITQVSDYEAFFTTEFEKLQVGTSITCVVLEVSGASVVLTCRCSFIEHRISIPLTSQAAKLGERYFGYVLNHSGDGTYINFFGHTTGFLPDKKLPIGDSVEVTVVKSRACPILSLSFSKFLENAFINNHLDTIQHYSQYYNIGDIVYLNKKKPFTEVDGYLHYQYNAKWTLVIIPAFDGGLPFEVTIFYIDENENKMYAIYSGDRTQKDSPLTFRAQCLFNFGSISVLRFKRFYYFVKSSLPLEIGSFVYASVLYSIVDNELVFHKPYCILNDKLTFFIAFIEKSEAVSTRSIIMEYRILFTYYEWIVCTKAHRKGYYFMHRTQIKGPIHNGLTVKAAELQLNNIILLVQNRNIPLFYEECEQHMQVVGALIKYDKNNKKHQIALSPFIKGVLKEKRISNKLYNTFNCTIIEINDNKLCCNIDECCITIKITGCCVGLYYNVIEESKNYILDITDCSDREFTDNETVKVFKIDEERVSYTVPAVSYQKIKVGDIISGYIYKVSTDKLYIHISRDINGIIPSDCYVDNYTSMEMMRSPELGDRLNCIVINDNPDCFILSCRAYDVNGKVNRPQCFHYYTATVVGIGENIVLYIDVLDLEIETEKILVDVKNPSANKVILEKDISLGCCVLVRCIAAMKKRFSITSLVFKPLFETSIDTQEDDTYIPLSDDIYIPLSDSDDIENVCDEDISINSSSQVTELTRIKTQKRQKIIEELKKPCNIAINELKPVAKRSYAAYTNLKPANTRLLLQYLKTLDSLDNIELICYKTNIGAKTLRKWHIKLQTDKNWSPLEQQKKPTRKAMDEYLEDSIMYYIYTKFLSKGYQFNDRMCKSIALKFWNRHPAHHISTKFSASARWIKRFKKRYDLVNRRVHYHRRPSIKENTIEICKAFHSKLKALYQRHKDDGTLHLLINIDETSWKICNFGDLTWASKGAEHVEFSSDFNEKEMVTAIAAISASEEHYKIPLCLIRKGKSDRAKHVFEEIKQYFQIEVSSNGWSNIKCFAHYLIWLRQELNEKYKNIKNYSPDQEIDVILDLYASHRNDKIKELAKALKFKLHFIPAGFTDSFQPLDRYVFGALKSMARAAFYDEYVKNPEAEHTIAKACKILLNCWAKLTDDTFKKAWIPYSNPNDEEIDSLIMRRSCYVDFVGQYLTIDEETPTGSYIPIVPNKIESHYGVEEDEEDEEEIAYSEFNKKVVISDHVEIQMKKNYCK